MGSVRAALAYLTLFIIFTVWTVSSARAKEPHRKSSQLSDVFQSTVQEMKAWTRAQAEEPNIFVLIQPGQPASEDDLSSFSIQEFKSSPKYQKLEQQFRSGVLKANSDFATYKILSVFKNQNAYCLMLEEKDPILKHEQCWVFSPQKIFALNQWGPKNVPAPVYAKLLSALERAVQK